MKFLMGKWKVYRNNRCASYVGTFYKNNIKYYSVVFDCYTLPNMYFGKDPRVRTWKASECKLIKEKSKLQKLLSKIRFNQSTII